MDNSAANSSRTGVVNIKAPVSNNTPDFDQLIESGRVSEKEGAVFYKLKYPIKLDNTPEVNELKFRRPKAKHSKQIRFSKESEIGILLEMTCALCDLSKFIADELDAWDLQNIGVIIGNFYYDPQKTSSNAMPI